MYIFYILHKDKNNNNKFIKYESRKIKKTNTVAYCTTNEKITENIEKKKKNKKRRIKSKKTNKRKRKLKSKKYISKRII